MLKELTTAVLRAVAGMRKRLAGRIPPLPRRRPGTTAARRAVRRAKRLRERLAESFDGRHLFVRRHQTPAERAHLGRLVRGPRPLRALRQIMDEAYRLFDRRCRADTALGKWVVLRTRVKRYRSLGRSLDKLRSPTPEKALEFLDDRLSATSNAVERSNRRHRKM